MSSILFSDIYIDFGRERKAHAEAQEKSWKAILHFFEKHLNFAKL